MNHLAPALVLLALVTLLYVLSTPTQPKMSSRLPKVYTERPRLHDDESKLPPWIDWLAIGAALSWIAIVLRFVR